GGPVEGPPRLRQPKCFGPGALRLDQSAADETVDDRSQLLRFPERVQHLDDLAPGRRRRLMEHVEDLPLRSRQSVGPLRLVDAGRQKFVGFFKPVPDGKVGRLPLWHGAFSSHPPEAVLSEVFGTSPAIPRRWRGRVSPGNIETSRTVFHHATGAPMRCGLEVPSWTSAWCVPREARITTPAPYIVEKTDRNFSPSTRKRKGTPPSPPVGAGPTWASPPCSPEPGSCSRPTSSNTSAYRC